jgi:hypothetical protein
MVRRLLAAILPIKSLTLEGAMEIVKYHINRNLIAYKSHRKKRLRLAKRLNLNVSL